MPKTTPEGTRGRRAIQLTLVLPQDGLGKGPQRQQLDQEGLHGEQHGRTQLLTQRGAQARRAQAGGEHTEGNNTAWSSEVVWMVSSVTVPKPNPSSLKCD